MSDNLTDVAEVRTLDWLTGNTVTAPVLPLKIALVTAAGSDSAAGTEVTGGSYARQNAAFSAAASGATANTVDIIYTGMPACTVVGIEIWDSAGTPVRWWYAPLAASKTLAAADEFKLAAGDVDLLAQ